MDIKIEKERIRDTEKKRTKKGTAKKTKTERKNVKNEKAHAEWMSRWHRDLPASYTVETAGVMAVVLFTIMILMGQALRLSGETRGMFQLHEQVERVRHEIEHKEDRMISIQSSGNGWELEITAPVFRPENFLRLWSLAQDVQLGK